MPEAIPKSCASIACPNTVIHSRYCDDCRRRNTEVILVIGPSGSGKSTLVRKHARRGDLVIDFDLLFQAVSGQPLYEKPESLLPFVLAARDSMLSLLGEVDDVPKAWVIRNKITLREIEQFKQDYDATVLQLRVPAEECKRRIDADPSRPHAQREQWWQRIDQWWSEHG